MSTSSSSLPSRRLPSPVADTTATRTSCNEVSFFQADNDGTAAHVHDEEAISDVKDVDPLTDTSQIRVTLQPAKQQFRRQISEGVVVDKAALARSFPYASLPKDYLRQLTFIKRNSNNNRGLLSPDDTELAEVRRVPSESADSGVFTIFGKPTESSQTTESAVSKCDTSKMESSQEMAKARTEPSTESSPSSSAQGQMEVEDKLPLPKPFEKKRRRFQKRTEIFSMIVFLPAIIAWLMVPALVIFAYSFENKYNKLCELLVWAIIPVATVVLGVSCILGNIYWYYDQDTNRWRYMLHCGRGPADFYWGDALTAKKEKRGKSGKVEVV